MITKFDKYINEGIRDLMTPKPEEEIRRTLEAKPPKDKIEMGMYKDIPWLVLQGLEENKDIALLERNIHLLRWSCERGYLEIVKKLLEKGVDIHTENDSALRVACNHGNTELVEFLLSKGADPNTDRGYLLPAMVSKGYYEITKLLLDAGVTSKINNALRIAQDNGSDEIVELLRKYEKVNEGVKDKMTPKSKDGIRNNLLKLPIKDFTRVSSQQNIDLKDFFSDEEIQEFNRRHNELLLAESDLHTGVYNNDISLVKKALKNKELDIDVKGKEFLTPLMNACRLRHKDIVEFLVEKGADVNLKGGRDNHTPLMLAVRSEDLDIVKILVENGANVNIKNSHGRTARRIAVEYGLSEISEYLKRGLTDDVLREEVEKLNTDADNFINSLRDIVYNNVNRSIPSIEKDEMIKVFLEGIGTDKLIEVVKKLIRHYDEKVQ